MSPQSSIIRPGTWLVAAVSHAGNSDSFASVVNRLFAFDAASIEIVQQLVGEQSVKD